MISSICFIYVPSTLMFIDVQMLLVWKKHFFAFVTTEIILNTSLFMYV